LLKRLGDSGKNQGEFENFPVAVGFKNQVMI